MIENEDNVQLHIEYPMISRLQADRSHDLTKHCVYIVRRDLVIIRCLLCVKLIVLTFFCSAMVRV